MEARREGSSLPGTNIAKPTPLSRAGLWRTCHCARSLYVLLISCTTEARPILVAHLAIVAHTKSSRLVLNSDQKYQSSVDRPTQVVTRQLSRSVTETVGSRASRFPSPSLLATFRNRVFCNMRYDTN